MEHVDEVRRYYEANTPAFQRFGHGSEQGVIRRAIWGEGVASRTEAFRYVDTLIAAEVRALQVEVASPLRVFDFGCGFGTSLLNLWNALKIQGVGFTLSPVQVRVAQQHFEKAKALADLQCLEADFLSLSDDVAPAHVVFAIESFVHSPSPQRFFESVARHITPGGTLIVCDDFSANRAAESLTARERRTLAEFRRGWVAPSVVTGNEANDAAAQSGFELRKDLDLTPHLELRRPRDRVLSAIVAVLGRLPIPGYRWRSLVGGNALQNGLMTGLIEHRFLTWRRRC